jgi:hypothetical protein
MRSETTLQNITAALVALLALFPGAARPTTQHTFLTSVDMSQPIGLAIVMLAIYSGMLTGRVEDHVSDVSSQERDYDGLIVSFGVLSKSA